ncbi:MAG: sulfate/thiosulfate transport system substrate-binding protein [Gaiellaceae bacterium]|jgi:sulfate transport system substrate-binding protein|nr:sulfate/thiosulfate transport system substrate-binding protein [Gaiellaceae bacterium]
MRRFLLLTLFIPVFAFTGIAAASGTTVNLVAFSTPKPVMEKLITRWTGMPAGQNVSFTQSYGPSGSQAKAIIAGQPADVFLASNALDVNSLVNAGLVQNHWSTTLPQGGMVANSVVTFVVRPGNPKGIHQWSDLIKPGVQVVTPDPFPSGGAKWNVLAAYGAERKMGKTNAQAIKYMYSLFHHVVQQDTSASAAMNTFLAGKGDVLLTYESEAYTALLAGKPVKLIQPKQTILIQLPMVPLKSAPTAASAFIKYARSYSAQKVFTNNGYRPVIKSVLNEDSLAKWKARFNIQGHVIVKISDALFGGWSKAWAVWFSPNGRMVKIEQAVGGPTS